MKKVDSVSSNYTLVRRKRKKETYAFGLPYSSTANPFSPSTNLDSLTEARHLQNEFLKCVPLHSLKPLRCLFRLASLNPPRLIFICSLTFCVSGAERNFYLRPRYIEDEDGYFDEVLNYREKNSSTLKQICYLRLIQPIYIFTFTQTIFSSEILLAPRPPSAT